ncbi:MAG: hypothetical protein IKW78_03415 [Prevotella sp.]|nr:hypothetical protein [Prevotella sp.]
MKKNLSLFALLVLTVTGAQAQTVISDVSQISDNKSYTVETKGRGSWTMNTAGTALRSTQASGVSSTAKQWAFVNYESNTYLYNVETKKFILKDGTEGSAEATHGTPITLYKYTSNDMDGWGASYDEYQTSQHYFIAQMGTAERYNTTFDAYINFGGSKNTTIDGWGPGNAPDWDARCGVDQGNALKITEAADFDPTEALTALDNYFNPKYTITYIVKDAADNSVLYTSESTSVAANTTITTLPDEYKINAYYTYSTANVKITEMGNTDVVFTATAKENVPVVITADDSNPYYYNLKIRGDYFMYDASADDKVMLQSDSEPFNPDASWAFIGNPYNLKLVNKTNGTEQGLIYTSVIPGSNRWTVNPDNHNIQFLSDADAAGKAWRIDTNDNGIVLRAVDDFSIYFHHDNIGFLRTCSVEEWESVHDDEGSTLVATTDEEALVSIYDALAAVPIGDGLNQYGSTDADFAQKLAAVKDDIDNKNLGSYANDYATLQDLQASLSLNLPQAGFYRIKGYSGNYMTFNAEGTNAAMSGTADVNNIVCYTPDKQLVFFVNGLGMYNTSVVGAPGSTLNAYTFSEGAQKGHYYIRSNAGSVGQYCYDNTANSTKVDRNSSPVTSGDYQTDWTLEAVTELPITLKAAECKDGQTRWFSTFAAPVAVSSVEGAEIHKVTDMGTYVQVEPANVTGIPAGTAVLLVSETNSANPKVVLGETTDAFQTALSPLYVCEKGKAGLFFGKNGNGKVGFFKLDSETKTGGFKAYLSNEGNGAKELDFGNEATGINSIENGADNGAVFNLQGQRVNKAQKGVYIQNGKKMVVR